MPETMRAWQYKSVTGGMEKNLSINDNVPIPQPKDNQVLVQVHSMALNPVDYKITESPAPLRLLGSVFTPGNDFCGKVTKVGKSAGGFNEGDMVFGLKVGDLANGTLAQYVAVDSHCAAKVPEGVATDDIAGLGIVGLTEIQALRPHVKEGDHVFINGGSGGTGVYGVQIAKALGCHVVTSCSTANVDFCKNLGADEVLDYKTSDIIKSLSEKGPVFKAVVDNIGTPANLYKASSAYIAPGGNFVQIGATPSLGSMMQIGSNILRPGFLGGGKAKYQVLMAKPQKSDLESLAGWMKEGKIRGVLDSVFEWEDAPKAYEKLKTGRAKGKIVVHVPHEK